MATKRNEALYRQYMLARRYAWRRADELAAAGKTSTEIFGDAAYKKLTEKEASLLASAIAQADDC